MKSVCTCFYRSFFTTLCAPGFPRTRRAIPRRALYSDPTVQSPHRFGGQTRAREALSNAVPAFSGHPRREARLSIRPKLCGLGRRKRWPILPRLEAATTRRLCGPPVGDDSSAHPAVPGAEAPADGSFTLGMVLPCCRLPAADQVTTGLTARPQLRWAASRWKRAAPAATRRAHHHMRRRGRSTARAGRTSTEPSNAGTAAARHRDRRRSGARSSGSSPSAPCRQGLGPDRLGWVTSRSAKRWASRRTIIDDPPLFLRRARGCPSSRPIEVSVRRCRRHWYNTPSRRPMAYADSPAAIRSLASMRILSMTPLSATSG